MWTADRLRNAFIEYFQSIGHTHWPSSSVSPDDPSLLFANSGMVQFKKKFLDLASSDTPYGSLKRACNYQKCIRAGGKHNDLDDVGKDTYHHTFFEMLGNWSFGDYFKKEAIEYAWIFLTEVLCLDKERIYVSYFHGDTAQNLPCDTEAQEIWRKYLPEGRILGFGAKENFWEMGPVGPCGPCSEIHYDQIGGRDASDIVNKDDPNVIEIWNIVFMEYNRESETRLSILPKKHIDTGMGLERVLRILQGELSNYNTDLFKPLFQTIKTVLDVEAYTDRLDSKADMAYRVIADHSRTLAIALMDGVMPSNEGRGYTIRKILRRALGFQYMHLKKSPGLLPLLVEQVFRSMEKVYRTDVRVDRAVEIVREEERQFTKTLTKGLSILMKLLNEAQEKKSALSGGDAFILYDRYGFPIDLTVAVAEQEGVAVETDEFKEAQERAKALSRSTQQATGGVGLTVHDLSSLDKKTDSTPTDETEKYKAVVVSARTVGVKIPDEIIKTDIEEIGVITGLAEESSMCGVVLDKTSFYSESGGQEGDTGRILFIEDDSEKGVLTVKDTKKYGRYVMHIGELEGKVTEKALCQVDTERRERLAHAHTATHLLNYALTHVLRKERPQENMQDIKQCGSLVSEDVLRFDFLWNQPLNRIEVSLVEETINNIIDSDEKVEIKYMPYKEAVKIPGIRHMEDEEYPERVRVVRIHKENSLEESSSVELCGGSHVRSTGEIGRVRIMSESSIARGIRRISALCGSKAMRAEEIAKDLLKEGVTPENICSVRDKLDSSDVPMIELGLLREQIEEEQKTQIRERKKHFESEAKRLKDIICTEEKGILFVCKSFKDTSVQQASKLIGPMVQMLEREKKKGIIIYPGEEDIILSGCLDNGAEKIKNALKSHGSIKIGGKSPKFAGVIQGEIESVKKAVISVIENE